MMAWTLLHCGIIWESYTQILRPFYTSVCRYVTLYRIQRNLAVISCLRMKMELWAAQSRRLRFCCSCKGIKYDIKEILCTRRSDYNSQYKTVHQKETFKQIPSMLPAWCRWQTAQIFWTQRNKGFVISINFFNIIHKQNTAWKILDHCFSHFFSHTTVTTLNMYTYH